MLIIGLVLFILVTTGVTIFLFTSNPSSDQLSKRARRLAGDTTGRRRGPASVAAGPQLRVASQGSLDAFVNRFLPQPEAMRQRLARSGSGLTIGRYGLICVGVSVVAAGLAFSQGLNPLLAVLVGVPAGLWLPHMAIGNMIQGRQKKFLALFPDAIGLLVRGLKAGLPVNETMAAVSREIASPVGEEFQTVCEQIQLGQSVENALWAAAKRVDIPEFNFLVITVAVQRETGGNLAETLETLDETVRKRLSMKLKIKAISGEAVASALIIGALPFCIGGVLFFVSHDYVMTLASDPFGHVLLAFGSVSLAIGIFVMRRMINFDH